MFYPSFILSGEIQNQPRYLLVDEYTNYGISRQSKIILHQKKKKGQVVKISKETLKSLLLKKGNKVTLESLQSI